MLGRVVSPHDCALALAIPLTEAQFLADLDEAAPKDLAKSVRRSVRRRMGQPQSALYAQAYEPLVSLACEVAEEAKALGVTVYRGARLADMAAMLTAHRVVTLVAHWRFLMLDERAVLDAAGFQARLSAAEIVNDPDARRPIDALFLGDAVVRGAVAPAALAAALNRHMLPGDLYYQWNSGGELEPSPAAAPATGLTRVLLEEMYPGCFVPGLCLELADRLCTAWEFIDQIPDSFDGVLDLTVCNSLILAEALRRRRSGRLDTALSNAKPATAGVRLVIYRHVIRSLSRLAEPYEVVMGRAHVSLLRQQQRGRNEPT
jgi:hypothetical protein